MSIDKTVEAALQKALVNLTDLHLQTKQAHWNIKGENFQSLHEFLDTVTDEVRLAADEMAERIATLGGCPDGRSATVAADSELSAIEGGELETGKTYQVIEEKLVAVAASMKADIEAVDAVDRLSADLLTSTSFAMEKQAWMLRSSAK